MNDVLLAVLVSLAGGLGAASRYVIDMAFPEPLRERFSAGLLAVNLSGSFVLGLLTGLTLDHAVMMIVATGFLGGYTTFSAASLECIRQCLERRWWAAVLVGPGMLLATWAAATVGILCTA